MLYHNISSSERFLRFITGLLLILASFYGFSTLGSYVLAFTLTLIGIILLTTGLFGWCPIYSMFNYSSRRTGMDKISKKDIENAVKGYSRKPSQIEDISKPTYVASSTKVNTSVSKTSKSPKKKTSSKKKSSNLAKKSTVSTKKIASASKAPSKSKSIKKPLSSKKQKTIPKKPVANKTVKPKKTVKKTTPKKSSTKRNSSSTKNKK